jgi:transcriptional regulator with XRE-family HTH domain
MPLATALAGEDMVLADGLLYDRRLMDIEFYKQMGRRIAAFRHEKGWNQDDLGRESGVATSYIARIEVAMRKPKLEIVGKLAAALGVEVWQLFADRRLTADEQEWKRTARDLSRLAEDLPAQDQRLLIDVAQRLRRETPM